MSDTKEQKALLDVHHARLKALVDGDLVELERYVSDELIYTSPTGRTQTKQQVFEGFRSGRSSIGKMETHDTEVRFFDTAAVITYRAETQMSDGQTETRGFIRSTATYIKESVGWRLVSQHQTRIE